MSTYFLRKLLRTFRNLFQLSVAASGSGSGSTFGNYGNFCQLFSSSNFGNFCNFLELWQFIATYGKFQWQPVAVFLDFSQFKTSCSISPAIKVEACLYSSLSTKVKVENKLIKISQLLLDLRPVNISLKIMEQMGLLGLPGLPGSWGSWGSWGSRGSWGSWGSRGSQYPQSEGFGSPGSPGSPRTMNCNKAVTL